MALTLAVSAYPFAAKALAQHHSGRRGGTGKRCCPCHHPPTAESSSESGQVQRSTENEPDPIFGLVLVRHP
jgi:hypothetical protein